MTAVLDLGSFAAKLGAPGGKPTAIPIFQLHSGLIDPLLSKRPFAAFGSGMVYTESQFEKVFSLAQLLCVPNPKPDWTAFAQKLAANVAAATAPKKQLQPMPGNLDRICDQLQSLNAGQVRDVLMTHAHYLASKRELCELLFEKYGVERVLFAEQPSCALLSTGNVTGTAVLAGHANTHIVAIKDGYWVNGLGFYDSPLQSGHAANQYLREHLGRVGIQVSDEYVLNQLKLGDEFYLPDGQVVRNGRKLAELLFNDPRQLGLEDRVPVAVHLRRVLADTNEEDREKVSKQVVVAGGMAGYVRAEGVQRVERPEWAVWNGLAVVGAVAHQNAYITKQLLAERGDALWLP